MKPCEKAICVHGKPRQRHGKRPSKIEVTFIVLSISRLYLFVYVVQSGRGFLKQDSYERFCIKTGSRWTSSAETSSCFFSVVVLQNP
mgnify:FL=1